MSIAGYLSSRNNTELRMPKADASPLKAKGWPPIRFEGPVLNGEKSVSQHQRDVAILAESHPSAHRPNGPLCAAGKTPTGRTVRLRELNVTSASRGPIIVWKGKK